MKFVLDRDSFRAAQVDLFDQHARELKADQWAQNALANKDNILAEALSVKPPTLVPGFEQDMAAGAQSPAVPPPPPAAAAPLPPGPVPPAAMPAPQPSVAQVAGTQGLLSRPSGGRYSPYDDTFRRHAGPLSNDDEFLRIVAAGTNSESGWNPQAANTNGEDSHGLFQMNRAGGAGTGYSVAQLQDPEFASSIMVPAYARAYMQARQQNPGLAGAELASLVAAMAERPRDWQNPQSTARRNYADAYTRIMGGGGAQAVAMPQGAVGMPPGAQQGQDALPATGGVGRLNGSLPPAFPAEQDSTRQAKADQWAQDITRSIDSWLADREMRGLSEPTDQELSEFLSQEQLRKASQLPSEQPYDPAAAGQLLQNIWGALTTNDPYAIPGAQQIDAGFRKGFDPERGFDPSRLTSEDERKMARAQLSGVVGMLNPEAAAFGATNTAVRGAAGKAAQSVGRFAAEESGELRLPGAGAAKPAVGARMTDDEVATLLDHLESRYDDMQAQLDMLEGQAGQTYNPGRAKMLQNQADRLRAEMDEMLETAKYVDAHKEMPPPKAPEPPADLPPSHFRPPLPVEDLPPAPAGPQVAIDDASLRQQGHVFGEMQAAKKAAQLPKSTPPEGARPIGLTTEQEIQRLRLEQWPEELRDTIREASEARGFARNQRRGVIGDAVSEGLADLDQRTFDDWVRTSKAGKAYNAEELRALRNAIGAQAAQLRQLTSEVNVARQAGNLTDNLLIRQFSEGQKLQALSEVFEGGKAEWGRGGRAFQGAARLVDLPPDEATARIYQMVGGRENALKVLEEYHKLLESGADAIAQARFWSRVKNPPAGVTDWFEALRYNSMLSGPRTFEIAASGNLAETAWKGLIHDVPDALVARDFKRLDSERVGAAIGAQRGLRNAMQVLTRGISEEAAAAGDLPRGLSARVRNPVGRKAAVALEVPGRIMGALDEFGSAIAYGMELGRLAGKKATSMGLKGDAWWDQVHKIMDNPAPALTDEALRISREVVLKGEMPRWVEGGQSKPSLGGALSELQRVPVVGNIIMPFLKTTYHAVGRGIDRSPVGFIGTGIDAARGVYRPGQPLPKGIRPLGERLRENTAGTIVAAEMYRQALGGNLTGKGPDDPEKRAELRAQGWQPYSVRVGDQYISYANWGPFAVPLSMAAAAAEGQTYAKAGAQPQDVAVDMLGRFAAVAQETTYLQGIGAIWKAMDDPKRYGGQWLSQFVGSLVPYGSAINTAGQVGDPYQRQPEFGNIGQALAYRNVPGTGGRESVPLAQDPLGRPMPNQQSGAGALNPIRVSDRRPDATIQLFAQAGVDLPKGDDRITVRNGRSNISISITPEEQRVWQQEFGRIVELIGQQYASSQAFASAPIDVRAKELQAKVIAEARKYADTIVAQRIGGAEIGRRLQEDRAKPKRVPLPTP